MQCYILAKIALMSCAKATCSVIPWHLYNPWSFVVKLSITRLYCPTLWLPIIASFEWSVDTIRWLLLINFNFLPFIQIRGKPIDVKGHCRTAFEPSLKYFLMIEPWLKETENIQTKKKQKYKWKQIKKIKN